MFNLLLFQFGTIIQPAALDKFNPGNSGTGIGNFLNLIFQIMVVGAGLYALINFILAGYAFLSAGEDSKKIEAAWAKIWQSALGLAFAAGAFVLAAIFGKIIFNDWNFILNPCIPAPGAQICP